MQLIVLTGIILLMLGLITLNSQVSIAKHEESSDSDKSKSDSNNQATAPTVEPTTNKEVNPSDNTAATVGNVVIPLQETAVQQQNTVTPQVTQAVHTGYLDNSLNTISTQDNDINDTTLLIQLNNSAQ
jgi:hypothetical protein